MEPLRLPVVELDGHAARLTCDRSPAPFDVVAPAQILLRSPRAMELTIRPNDPQQADDLKDALATPDAWWSMRMWTDLADDPDPAAPPFGLFTVYRFTVTDIITAAGAAVAVIARMEPGPDHDVSSMDFADSCPLLTSGAP